MLDKTFNDEDMEKLDGFFNKGWNCDLDEIHSIVVNITKELETYKKIAEKMADYINELVPFSNPRALPLMIVDDEYKTSYRTRKNTIEVFEYLARKEVEKDE